jgi:hypothetical protein
MGELLIMSRRTLVFAGLSLLAGGAYCAKVRLDAAALTSAGYAPERGSPDEYFAALASEGLTPAEVARRMPPPFQVERYVAPFAGGPDSALLERFVYRFGPGSWPVYIYYRKGGGVTEVYAQDVPSLAGARRVSASEAERWRLWPQVEKVVK